MGEPADSSLAQSIVASLGAGIIVYDCDLRITAWNPFMEQMTGMPAERVIGRPSPELFPYVMAAGVIDNLRQALAGGPASTREFEFNVPETGRRGWVMGTYRPLRDPRGKVVGAVGSIIDITERHRAEAALAESEARFRAIFDSIGDAVVIVEPGGRFLEVNAAALQRYGYSREEMIGLPLATILDADGPSQIDDRTQVITGAEPLTFESRHVTRDGTVIPVEIVSRLVEYRGQPAVLSVYRDLSERQRADRARREQARFLQQLLDAMPMPINAKDRSGRLTVSNQAFALGPGLSQEQIVGRTVGEIGLEERAIHEDADRAVLDGRGVQSYEVSMKFAGGTVRRLLISKAPLHGEDGSVEGIATAGTDITERFEAEQALRRSEERFRKLFERAANPILITDVEGRPIEANDAACQMLGYTRDELTRVTVGDVTEPERRDEIRGRIQELLEHGSYSYESTLVARDGHIIPVEGTLTTIDLAGKPAILAILRDLTERRKAEAERTMLEDQLRQSQKMEAIGQLAGGIAHDFNNLLTAIRGNADLALMDLPADSPARDELEQIESAADRAAGLTRQLLAFARRTVLSPEVVDLGEVVRKLEPMLRRILGEDVALTTSTRPSRGWVVADPTQIEQVIVNLAVNARDAMPNGGTLHIETRDIDLDEAMVRAHPPARRGLNAAIVVTDTGQGMSAETLERAFEPFFTTKGPGKGTGLGLATVYGIVRQSGGAVWARSEPGRGSSFTVCLPLVAREAPAATRLDREASPAPEKPGNATILVVEDDEGVRSFTTRVLAHGGYRVLAASGGLMALEMAESHRPDLLLSDLVMPWMTGPEVAAKVRAKYPGLRVMFMSGYADATIVDRGILEPNSGYLAKPFTAPALLEAVGAALEKSTPEQTPRPD